MSMYPPRAGKRALITGITGQDGSYLAELLLHKGYEVWGLVRRTSSIQATRISHLYQDPHEPDVRLHLCHGDLTDSASLHQVLSQVRPDEIYNLAAQSHVKISFQIPEYTANVTGVGPLRLLEASRQLNLKSRFYQASSSEIFGRVVEVPQRETTPLAPQSPYAAAKAMAFYLTRNYREAYGMFAVNGILFNHESPRRGDSFVTRKITRAVASIVKGVQDVLYLGNLDAQRDWGFAGDYVEAMWAMLQAEQPSDFVIATGQMHSVREFCELAFAQVDMPLTWEGEECHEVGIGPGRRVLVRVDERYFRPTDVNHLLGDASRAHELLGWRPRVAFPELVAMMVQADLSDDRSA